MRPGAFHRSLGETRYLLDLTHFHRGGSAYCLVPVFDINAVIRAEMTIHTATSMPEAPRAGGGAAKK